MKTAARFTYSTPQHQFYPAVIDWHIWDDGERISPENLAIRANKLQRRVEELEAAAHSAATISAEFFALVSA